MLSSPSANPFVGIQPAVNESDITELSLSKHLVEVLAMDSTQRDRYLRKLAPELADEIALLLQFESSAVDLSQAAGVSVARQLLEHSPPEWLGRWRVIELIGRGGMGAVYLVEHEALGVAQRAAAKLGWSPAGNDFRLNAIRREANALSRLRHPNIATLLDFGVTSLGEPYVVSEFVAGQPLTDFATSRKLDADGRLELFLQLLGGVAAAHAALVLHLDIKPNNVLVTDQGTVKLIDFGLSGLLQTTEDGQALSSVAPGLTKAYASPEQRADQVVTIHSDIYSLGLLLDELVRNVNATDRRGMDAIIATATAREIQHRYSSASTFAQDIQALREGRPVTPLRHQFGYRWRSALRRQWLPLGLAGIALLTLLVGLIMSNRQYQRTVVERNRAIELLESERATSDFFTQSLRQASVFGGGDAEMTVAEMLDHMLDELPAAEKMSDRSTAWVASDLAAVFTGLGRFDEALAACELAVRHAERSADPEDDITHWTQYALTAGQAHRYSLALQAAERARAIAAPLNHWRLPWAYLARMQTLVKMKRWQEVVDLWPVIAEIPTERKSVQGNIDYMRGAALIFLGDHSGAARDLESAERIYTALYGADSVPVADIYFRRYQSLLMAGDLPGARIALAALAPRFLEAYGADHYRNQVLDAETALVAFYQGQLTVAIAGFESAISRLDEQLGMSSPIVANYRGYLARTLLQHGDIKQAENTLQMARRSLEALGATHPDFLSLQISEAEALLQQGQTTAAEDRLRQLADRVTPLPAGETRFRWQRASIEASRQRSGAIDCTLLGHRVDAPTLAAPSPFPGADC